AVVLVVGGRDVLAHRMTVGSLLVFVAYARTLQAQAESLLTVYRALRAGEAGLDRVQAVLGTKEEVPEPAHPVRFPAQEGPSRLEFDRVTFGYNPGTPVLEDITLEIEPGHTVALVGRSGAGKSTLVSLIPRFFDPWSGRVLIDGTDIRDVRVHDVRQKVSVVRQDPLLLPVSMADNIAYGRPGATRDEIEQAARDALASDFIEALPDGYDTVIGERGATLSGGQRQRLAIARALLKDAPILILDEPTAALDAESEAVLVAAVDRLTLHRTVLVIAHRLSTIRRADRIVVLDEGRIVEDGSHTKLMRAGGPYAHMYNTQFGPITTSRPKDNR
ncbi:MAG TPA: ABC transporter ATP-binding protein, partial [Acidimicrobiales bacterium]|nr:ABC transporter ATP-binding protein [Acidimicrobiales bacterium]